MDTVLCAVAYAAAVMVAAALAHNFGRLWLQEQAAMRVSNERLIDLEKESALHTESIGKLAIDWRKKFDQLEHKFTLEWQQLKEHADSQYAGATAQLVAKQTAGYHR